MNLIFRSFRRECSGLCASTQTTQTITESVRRKAWRQGRSRRKSFAQYMVPPRSILVFRGFKPISGPASEKDGKKAGKVVKSVKRQNVRKEPAKEAETVVAAAREL